MSCVSYKCGMKNICFFTLLKSDTVSYHCIFLIKNLTLGKKSVFLKKNNTYSNRMFITETLDI